MSLQTLQIGLRSVRRTYAHTPQSNFSPQIIILGETMRVFAHARLLVSQKLTMSSKTSSGILLKFVAHSVSLWDEAIRYYQHKTNNNNIYYLVFRKLSYIKWSTRKKKNNPFSTSDFVKTLIIKKVDIFRKVLRG